MLPKKISIFRWSSWASACIEMEWIHVFCVNKAVLIFRWSQFCPCTDFQVEAWINVLLLSINYWILTPEEKIKWMQARRNLLKFSLGVDMTMRKTECQLRGRLWNPTWWWAVDTKSFRGGTSSKVGNILLTEKHLEVLGGYQFKSSNHFTYRKKTCDF